MEIMFVVVSCSCLDVVEAIVLKKALPFFLVWYHLLQSDQYPPAYENALKAGGTSASTTKRKVSPTSAAGTSKKTKAKATAGGKKR